MSRLINDNPATYVRRRAFNKVHIRSWQIYLEKDGFVRCSFKDCNFMAFSGQEMLNHYGYCKGKSCTEKFVCSVCNGRTDSLLKLQHHQARSHQVSSSEEPAVASELRCPELLESGKPSPVVLINWEYSIGKNNCIKCSECNFLANSLSEMVQHYTICKEEMESLIYVCPICKGRTVNVHPLIWHLERSHKITKPVGYFNVITKTMVQHWERELKENKPAKCLHMFNGQRDCFYYNTDILGIIEHCQSCKGLLFETPKEEGPDSPQYSNPVENLAFHVSKKHFQISDKSEEDIAVHVLPSSCPNEQIISIGEEITESIASPSSNNNQIIYNKVQSKTHEVKIKNEITIHKVEENLPLGCLTITTKDAGHSLTMGWDKSTLKGVNTDGKSIFLNLKEDLKVRIGKHDRFEASKESSTTSHNEVFVQNQCVMNPLSSIKPGKSSMSFKNDTVKNNHQTGNYVCSVSNKKVALAVHKLDTDNFVIDLSPKEEPNEQESDTVIDSSNEENSCDSQEQSAFINLSSTFESSCKIEGLSDHKTMRKCYEHQSQLFKDECSSDDYDDYFDDEIVEEEYLSTPDSSSTIYEPQEEGFGKSVKNYLRRSGIKTDGKLNVNSAFISTSSHDTFQCSESFAEGCQVQEDKFVENVTITKNRCPTLRTYQKVDPTTLENCVNKKNVSPEEMSKSSEKNDKLMSDINPSKSNFNCDSMKSNTLKTAQANYNQVMEFSLALNKAHSLCSPSFKVVSEIPLQKSIGNHTLETKEHIFETKSNNSTLPDFYRDLKCNKSSLGTHSKPKKLNMKSENSSQSSSMNEIVIHQKEKKHLPECASNQQNTVDDLLSSQQTSQTSQLISVTGSISKNKTNKREEPTYSPKKTEGTVSSRSQDKTLKEAATFKVTDTLSVQNDTSTRAGSKDNNESLTVEFKKTQHKKSESSNVTSNVSFLYHGRLTKKLSDLKSTSEVTAKTEREIHDTKSLVLNSDFFQSKEDTLKHLPTLINVDYNCQGEKFLNPNKMFATKNDKHCEFREMPNKIKSGNVKCHDFLRRLSESENEMCNSPNINEVELSPNQSLNESFSCDSQTEHNKSIKECTDINNISLNIEIQDEEMSCLPSFPNLKMKDLKETAIGNDDKEPKTNFANAKNLDGGQTSCEQQFTPEKLCFEVINGTKPCLNNDNEKAKLISTCNGKDSYCKNFVNGQNIKRNYKSSHKNWLKASIKKTTNKKKRKDVSFAKILSKKITLLKKKSNNTRVSYGKALNEKLPVHITGKDSTPSALVEGSNQALETAACTTKHIILDTLPNSSYNNCTSTNKFGNNSNEKLQISSGSLKGSSLQARTDNIRTYETQKTNELIMRTKSLKEDNNEHYNLTCELQSEPLIENNTDNSCTVYVSEGSSEEKGPANPVLLCSSLSTNGQDTSQTEKHFACANVGHEEIPPSNNVPSKGRRKPKLKMLTNKRESKTTTVKQDDENEQKNHSPLKSEQEKSSKIDSNVEKLEVVTKQENFKNLSYNETFNFLNITLPVLVPSEQEENYSEEQDAMKEDDNKLEEVVKNNSYSRGEHCETLKEATSSFTDTTTISSTCKNDVLSTLPKQGVHYSSPQKKRRGRPPKVQTNQTIKEDLMKGGQLEKNILSENCKTHKVAINNYMDNTTKSSLCNNNKSSIPSLPIQEICVSSLHKKRRGRPPKVQTNQIINEDLFKVGQLEENNLGENSKTQNEAISSCSQVTSISSSCNNNKSSTPTLPIQELSFSSPPKKRRGRPPKVKLILNDQIINGTTCNENINIESGNSDRLSENEGSLVRTKYQRRSKQSQIEESANHQTKFTLDTPLSDNKNSTLPKKRGRPPKVKLNSDQLEISVPVDDNVPLSKRIKRFYASDVKSSNELISPASTEKDTPDIALHETKKSSEKINVSNEVVNESSDEKSIKVLKPLKRIKKKTKRVSHFKSGPHVYFGGNHTADEKVTCAVCKLEMTFKEFQHHAVFKHYVLCWVEGDQPVDMDDHKDVVNRLWFAKKYLKKVPFRCFTCNLPKLSAVGFQSHIRFCGKEYEEKESLMVSCTLCSAKMMPASLTPHMYIKHNKVNPITTIVETAIIPKSKRAAASRATEVIMNHTKEVAEDSDSSRPASPDSKELLLKYYSKSTKMVNSKVYRIMKESLKKTNIAHCPYTGCEFSCDSTIAFSRHYLSCPLGPLRPYKCKKCDFNTTEEREIHDHILSKHEDALREGIPSESESSEDSDEDNNSSFKRLHYSNLPLKFLTSKAKPTSKHGKRRRHFFFESAQWTLELRKKIFLSDVLYKEYMPSINSWQPLRLDAVPQFLPKSEESLKFRGGDGTWQSLRRFEGTLLDGIPLIFTGGPVWALAWVPVTDSEVNQYLAVASHPNMDLTHEMATVYNYKSIIQLWNFGHLNNLEKTSEQTPTFMMGIAHSRGAVWALQWCPSGCYQDNRLGLLAAACSDGSIPIYSVPKHLQSFEHTIYDVQPVMELKLGSEMLSQCTSLEWHSVSPHNLIIGGFANGVAALWDLSSTSPLLRKGSRIYPFKIIEAHLASITGVSLSPSLTDTVVMTASLDRATKFWRLDDTTSPVNTLRKASVLSAVMPLNWLTSINAYDEIFSMNLTHITGYNYREAFNNNNINHLLQDSSVWDVSFNDWLNACACASRVGKLTAFLRDQILVSEDHKRKIRCGMKEDIATCLLMPLNNTSTTEELGHKFSDSVSTVGMEIIFNEKMLEKSKTKLSFSHDKISYPLASINKVSWNPNYQSFTWLVAGLQSGLVITPRFQSLLTQNLLDFYKQSRHL